MKRIVSLLPSATDVVGSLGLEEWLVGVSHECDWPARVRNLPRLTRSTLAANLPPAELDARVNQSIHTHQTLYDLDVEQLRQLKPDIILTQELCDVCAVNYDQVLGAARVLRQDGESPAILSLEPTTLDEVLQTVQIVADELGETERGQHTVARLRERLASQRQASATSGERPSVLVLEWPDPPWIGGHWVPDLVDAAGGRNVTLQAERRGQTSIRVGWDQIQASDPDLIVLAPCGFDREQATAAIAELRTRPECAGLRATREGRIYPVDANSYFSRPGPRVLEGIAELQAILAVGTPLAR